MSRGFALPAVLSGFSINDDCLVNWPDLCSITGLIWSNASCANLLSILGCVLHRGESPGNWMTKGHVYSGDQRPVNEAVAIPTLCPQFICVLSARGSFSTSWTCLLQSPVMGFKQKTLTITMNLGSFCIQAGMIFGSKGVRQFCRKCWFMFGWAVMKNAK